MFNWMLQRNLITWAGAEFSSSFVRSNYINTCSWNYKCMWFWFYELPLLTTNPSWVKGLLWMKSISLHKPVLLYSSLYSVNVRPTSNRSFPESDGVVGAIFNMSGAAQKGRCVSAEAAKWAAFGQNLLDSKASGVINKPLFSCTRLLLKVEQILTFLKKTRSIWTTLTHTWD